ncbi:ABC transporter permease [Demequina muriae]|uniref:ABC transporter permease n=1 Tax=Demequina muriae TaxID=3051664 RepID=A0ABT8GHX2_9MICO|nr:ABC transporter permease [Demequina sp. EGI L300058]MDN4480969.1 ABC transporter permease [Demequina sp. EGI L300058]
MTAIPEPSSAPTAETGARLASWRLLLRNPVTVASSIVLILVVLIAAFAPLIAPHGVNVINVPGALQAPSAEHWFGTDDLGRDVFSRVLMATRVSLIVALASVAFAFVLGVTLGIVSGFIGGKLDAVLMRGVDVMFAFPVILLALAIIAVLGPGMATTMLAIGIVYTPIFARVARASALSVSVQPFVQVSHTMGTGRGYILSRHVLPNITGPIIVQTSLSLAFAILSEASLSFLGLGVQPPAPSWGGMLSDARPFLESAWWLGVFPGLAILVTVLAFNLVGDGLRDVLDPRQRTIMEARARR